MMKSEDRGRLYVLDLRSCGADCWPALLSTLPPERQRRVRACRRPEDRARLCGAGWLLQYALAHAGISAEEQRFTQTPWGKPCLADRTKPHFSLSHSGSWVVCALSGAPVGVDVEQPRCTEAVARRYFLPAELEALPDRSAGSLTRLWTAKEAFVKALGLGLTLPLTSFTVLLEPAPILRQNQRPLPYRLHEYQLEDCPLCLCAVDDRPEPIHVSLGV